MHGTDKAPQNLSTYLDFSRGPEWTAQSWPPDMLPMEPPEGIVHGNHPSKASSSEGFQLFRFSGFQIS